MILNPRVSIGPSALGVLLLFGSACGDDGGTGGTETATSPTTNPSSTDPTTGATAGTGSGTTGSTSDSGSGSDSDSASTTDSPTSGSTSMGVTDGGTTDATTGSTGAANEPPVWDSMPTTEVVLTEVYKSKFAPNQVFLSSSVTDEIRVYDGETLEFVQAFTHPSFSKVNSSLFTYGPNGAAFNERGNLVVAAREVFVEFSDYGVEYATYPKVTIEANENLIFDPKGNLYTTTSSGGTDKLNMYRAEDYKFEMTIPVPDGAGQLTGITFDGAGRIYVGSQTDNNIHVSKPNFDLTWDKKFSGAGNPGYIEGMQINANGELIVAAKDIVRYAIDTGMKVGTFDDAGDAFPVPVRVDNRGAIYVADFESGTGTLAADLLKFTPDGVLQKKINDTGLRGPFGLAISGTVLAGDPPVDWTYPLVATDPDGDPLTYNIVQGPGDMYIDGMTNTLIWGVTSEDVGLHDIILSVDDVHGHVVEQQFTLNIVAG